MKKRTSIIDLMNMTSISYSSILNIGDTQQTDQKFRGIAVQKELDNFPSPEKENFADFPIFQREANYLKEQTFVNKQTYNHNDTIRVRHVSVIGVSSSSILQAGVIKQIHAESRIKHFRRITR